MPLPCTLKNSNILTGRKCVRVPLLLFGLGPAPRVFTNININTETFDDLCNTIFGPSPNFLEYFGENTYGTRLYDFPSEVSRFCDKFQKMYFGTNPGDRGDRVSGYDCKLKNNNFVFTFRKGKKNKENKVTLNLLAKEENVWWINRIE